MGGKGEERKKRKRTAGLNPNFFFAKILILKRVMSGVYNFWNNRV